MPRLIVVGSPGSGRSTFAYDMQRLAAVKAKFDSYAFAERAAEVLKMTRGAESVIVLLIDYPRFKEDAQYRTNSVAEAESLRGSGLKFVVVANKIGSAEDTTPSSAKDFLTRYFLPETTFVYDSAQSVMENLPGPIGDVAKRALHEVSRVKGAKPFDFARDRLMYLDRVDRTKPEMDKAKTDISNALVSPGNTNPSFEFTGPGGIGLKASGPVAYPFIVIVSFVLVFYTLNQILPNVKDVFTQAIFVLALLIGMGLLAFVWIQSNRLVKTLGSSTTKQARHCRLGLKMESGEPTPSQEISKQASTQFRVTLNSAGLFFQ